MAGIVLIFASLATFVYCMRRRAKVTEKIESLEKDDFPEKHDQIQNMPSFLFSDHAAEH